MIWDDPDFQKYFRSLMVEFQTKSFREAQQVLDTFHADVGRSNGVVVGVHVASTIGAYMAKVLREPAAYSIEAFQVACASLGMEPDEEDYDKLFADIESFVHRGMDSSRQHLQEELTRYNALGHISAIVQVEGSTIAEVRQRVERKKLEARRRTKLTGVRTTPTLFLSHVVADAALASRLKGVLKTALGEDLSIFVSSDFDSIRSGAEWHGAILAAIRKSRAVLVLVTPDSYLRPWINYEAGVGDGVGAEIIPIVACGFSRGELRPPLGRYQARSLESAEELGALLRHLGTYTERAVQQVEAKEVLAAAAVISPAGKSVYTKEEADILVASSVKGEIHLIESQSKWIQVGRTMFMSPEDSAIAAGYVDALFVLVRLGLATHESGNLYMLTGEGFKVGRKLASERRTET